jgi:transcriptional regulator GlxA family with amidase domain
MWEIVTIVSIATGTVVIFAVGVFYGWVFCSSWRQCKEAKEQANRAHDEAIRAEERLRLMEEEIL